MLSMSIPRPWRSVLVLGTAVLAVGCAAFDDRLIVRRLKGVVRIQGEREGRMVTVQREPIPLSDCRVIDVEGTDAGGEEIWRVTTIESSAAAANLRYGQTPAGYAQVTPLTGRPPPLRPGGRYRVECLGPRWLSTSFTVPEDSSSSD